MNEEFEDQQGVGELPHGIAVERGENWKDKDVFNISGNHQGIPPDIATSNGVMQVASKQSSNISPQIPSLVESTFDTRPVNGRDFYITGREFFNWNSSFPTLNIDTISLTRNVPNGYVGILRGFRFGAFSPLAFPANESRYPDMGELITATLLKDNVIIPGYDNIQVGQIQNELIPVHSLVNENKTFTIKLKASNYYMEAINEHIGFNIPYYFSIEMYGNELLSRGLPLEFENMSQTSTGIG